MNLIDWRRERDGCVCYFLCVCFWVRREGRGNRALIIERQELVETGGGHMGGGTQYSPPQLTLSYSILYTTLNHAPTSPLLLRLYTTRSSPSEVLAVAPSVSSKGILSVRAVVPTEFFRTVLLFLTIGLVFFFFFSN